MYEGVARDKVDCRFFEIMSSCLAMKAGMYWISFLFVCILGKSEHVSVERVFKGKQDVDMFSGLSVLWKDYCRFLYMCVENE